MTKFLLGLFVSVQAFASAPNVCMVSVTDLKNGNYAVIGIFDAELGEEELTTKTFELKDLKQVVTARVYFTDELVGIKWGADGSVNDISTTVRIDVEKKAKKGNPKLTGPGTQTRAILSNWGDVNAAELCKKALADKNYAAEIAPGGNLPILLDSCEAYLDNNQTNTMVVAKTVKGQEFRLSCTENK